MAFTFGAAEQAHSVGIDIIQTPATITNATTSVTFTIKYQVKCTGNGVNDSQRLNLTASTDGYYDYLMNNTPRTVDVGTRDYTYDISGYGGPQTYTTTATVSGHSNGATPTHTRTFTRPQRPFAKTNAPAGLVATSVTGTTLTFAWNAPTSNGGQNPTKYRIQRATNSAFTADLYTLEGAYATRTQSYVSLAKSTTYYFRVYATNSAGESAASATYSVKTHGDPSVPRTVAVSAVTDKTATCTWTAPSDTGGRALVRYALRIATNSAMTTGVREIDPDNTSLTNAVTGLTEGTNYWIQVRASNGLYWGAYSAAVTFKTIGPPSAPSALSVSGITDKAATATWTAPADTGGRAITQYALYLAENSGMTTGTRYLEGTRSLIQAIPTLKSGTDYWVQVRASNSQYWSVYSTPVKFTTKSIIKIYRGGVWKEGKVNVRRGTAWQEKKARGWRAGGWRPT